MPKGPCQSVERPHAAGFTDSKGKEPCDESGRLREVRAGKDHFRTLPPTRERFSRIFCGSSWTGNPLRTRPASADIKVAVYQHGSLETGAQDNR